MTRHGYEVTATPDHPFLTTDRGYVPLSELQPGDRLLLQSQEGAWSSDDRLPNVEFIQEKMAVMGRGGDRLTGHLITRRDFAGLYAHLPTTWSHDLGMVLGCLVGDGWLSGNSGSPVGMVFAKSDQESLEAIHTALQEWFGPGHLHERSSVFQLTYGHLPYEFFKSLGVFETRASEKRVPETIWQAPREAVVGFLQGLFDNRWDGQPLGSKEILHRPVGQFFPAAAQGCTTAVGQLRHCQQDPLAPRGG